MSAVARARPDGHMLFMNEITSTVVKELVPGLTFDPVRSLEPAVLVAETPFVLVINSNVPARDLKEFIAYAQSHPGKITYGSGGVGSGPHPAGELFRQLTRADILHVPYRGSGPALQDLLGGQIQMLITAAPTVAPMIKDGRLRALTVARSERIAALPDVPTAAEAGLAWLRDQQLVLGWPRRKRTASSRSWMASPRGQPGLARSGFPGAPGERRRGAAGRHFRGGQAKSACRNAALERHAAGGHGAGKATVIAAIHIKRG